MGPTVVGTWNGYPFVATLRIGRMNVLNASFTYLRGPSAKQVRQAGKTMPRGCALSYAEGKLSMVCSARDDQLFDLFQAGMEAASALLRDCGTTLSGSCALCKQGGCDSFALANGGFVPVHQTCCENTSRDKAAQAAMNSMNGNYATGWIGALLGGLVGAIPTILLAWFLEMVSGWLCALIPLGAYYGYKLFKGKMDRMATIASIVSALLQVFMVEQVIFYISIVKYMGLWLTPFASIAYYFEIMEPADMAADMIMPLLFTIFGIFIVYGIIKRTGQDEIQDAGVMSDSLTDLNGVPRPKAQPQPQAQSGQWGQWGQQQAAQPNQWDQSRQAPQPNQWSQPQQPQPNQWAQPQQPAQPNQWAQPQQPAQPNQWAQPQQPVQPNQWAQPQQPVQPNQWSQPQQPAQHTWEPATAARPLVSNPRSSRPIQPGQVPPAQHIPQPVQPAPQPIPPTEAVIAPPPQPSAAQAPTIQSAPAVQDVKPLDNEMPKIPDLPQVPSVSPWEDQ